MNIEQRNQAGLAWPNISNFLRSIWERQWILVCVGIISIATVGIGGGVASLGLITPNTGQQIAGSQRIGGIDFVGLPTPNPSMQGQEVYNVRVWVQPYERQMIWDQYWDEARFLFIFGAATAYVLLLMRAGPAMFDTDRELVERGTDRRRAVRSVYRLFFWQMCFLLGLTAIVVLARWG